MPKILVEIDYDNPSDPYWLNPDNVAVALAQHCPNTTFRVVWAPDGNPWAGAPPSSVDEVTAPHLG